MAINRGTSVAACTLDVCMGLGQSTYSQPTAYGAAVTTYVSASPYGVVSSGYAAPSEQPPAYGQPSYGQPGEIFACKHLAIVGPNGCSDLILYDSDMNLYRGVQMRVKRSESVTQDGNS